MFSEALQFTKGVAIVYAKVNPKNKNVSPKHFKFWRLKIKFFG